MILRKRQTALGIAAKLPVADLLPMLIRPTNPRWRAASGSASDCNCVKTALALRRPESRTCAELEQENARLREVIAHLAVSINSPKSDWHAAD
jgi:hypothetical protein